MHAADAIHGDLGMIRPDDVVVCISKSGNTPEIKILIPLVKNFGNKLIAIVGNTDSFLAREADIVLDTTVQHEACPHNLAPTSSTTRTGLHTMPFRTETIFSNMVYSVRPV